MISTFPPTRCGLATYAEDLIAAMRAVSPRSRVLRVGVAASTENQNAGADFVIRRSDGDGWKNAAQWLSESGVTSTP